MSEIVLVVAAAENGVIGKDGKIPWHISDDLKRFKALTMNHSILMGRKTWDSLPRKPLPGRNNIVLTRQKDWEAPGAWDIHSPDAALDTARRASNSESATIFVIGGAEIYNAFLPSATRIELTEVHGHFDGDATFTFDRTGWREIARERHAAPDGLAYSYVTLIRV